MPRYPIVFAAAALAALAAQPPDPKKPADPLPAPKGRVTAELGKTLKP